MKNIEIKFNMQLKQEDELDDVEKKVIEEAKQATFTSYSPYSNFSVGAAVLLENDVIVTGSNQENSAFPSGLCAERTALFYSNSKYDDQPVVCLAIAARNTAGVFTEEPVYPCGACRQVFVETVSRFKRTFKVLLYGTKGTYVLESALDLMPLSFDSTFL